jgi:hypothetical protein
MRRDAQLIAILHMLAVAVLMLLTTELVGIARTLLVHTLEGR